MTPEDEYSSHGGTDGHDGVTGNDGDAGDDSEDGGPADTPPEEVVDEAERLTRLARDAVDDAEAAAYREAREEALADHGYTTRVREEDDGAVLVCHPAEWLEDGVVRTDRIQDVDRGIERRIAGVGDSEEWEAVETANRDLATTVEAAHGAVHGANAHALADFMGNHYAKPIEDATRAELREFLTEYFPRNAFPSDDQRDCVEKSVRLVYEETGREFPLER